MPRMREAMRSGWNGFQPRQLLADAGELDRLAGDVTHRQRRATARIAVQLGEDHTAERQRVTEGLGDVDRVLALHGVDHEQRLGRRQRGVQCADLVHHGLVDGEPARRCRRS